MMGLCVITSNGISIHALREEGDHPLGNVFCSQNAFLSTPSARRATRLPTRGHLHRGISIHALREEGDLARFVGRLQVWISIHALREEGDRLAAPTASRCYLFLSTPSARRATLLAPIVPSGPNDFYPRPPRGGRLFERHYFNTFFLFLSTPSARRATSTGTLPRYPKRSFLSTPSARRATSYPA